VARDAVFGLVGMVEGAVLAAQWQPQTLLGQGIMCVQASQLASLPPALQTGLGWAEDPAGTASDLVGPRDLVCAGFMAHLTAPSLPV
jgi:hypothetical protein